MEGLNVLLQQDNGAMEGLRLQLALARLELELSQSAREQAASDLSLTRWVGCELELRIIKMELFSFNLTS